MYHTAIYLLAVMLHESGRQLVAEGKTLAHALKSPQVRPFSEWPDLPAEVQHGRRMTARGLLELFHVGEPFPDLGTDPVSDRDLAEAIHESERKAVEAGRVVVSLGRPWTPFDELPEIAREGRMMQARYLKARAFFAPRQPEEAIYYRPADMRPVDLREWADEVVIKVDALRAAEAHSTDAVLPALKKLHEAASRPVGRPRAVRGYMGSTPDGGIDDGDRDTLKPGDTGAAPILASDSGETPDE